MSNVPWFGPGVAVSMLVALAAMQIGLITRGQRILVGARIFSLGVILSATMTPLRSALEVNAVGTGMCDFSRVGLAPIAYLTEANDISLNIVLFIPLGVVAGMTPFSLGNFRVVIACVALPVLIESLQLLLPVLARGCQSADVVDNLTGLAIGLVAGIAFQLVSRRLVIRCQPDRR